MSCPTKAKEHCELKKKQNKVNKVAKYQTTTMMMKCFCGMVDRQKTFRLISSGDHCQGFLPSRISDTSQTGFERA